VLIGNGILLLLGLGVAAMTARFGLNTVANAERFLGKKGCALFALSFLIVKAGWFAIGLDLMGKSLGHPLFNVLLGGAIIAVVLAGIKGVGRVAVLTMPLLIGTMAASLFMAEGTVLSGRAFPWGRVRWRWRSRLPPPSTWAHS
jgi:purine-cytosine permease-like protein